MSVMRTRKQQEFDLARQDQWLARMKSFLKEIEPVKQEKSMFGCELDDLEVTLLLEFRALEMVKDIKLIVSKSRSSADREVEIDAYFIALSRSVRRALSQQG